MPKTRQIDLKRFPTIPMLKQMLLSAGFNNTRYHIVSGGTTKIPMEEYLEKIRKKFISTLTLLTEEEFQEGLKIFERKLREKWGKKDTGNEIIYEKEYTFVVGEKRKDLLSWKEIRVKDFWIKVSFGNKSKFVVRNQQRICGLKPLIHF